MARYSTAGSRLQITNNAVFVNVNGVESISGPTGTKQEIDATALEDTAATKLGGMPDYGTITVGLIDDAADAMQVKIKASYDNPQSVDQFKIILPFPGTGNTLTGNGSVTGWSLSLEKNAPAKVQVTITCSGTWART